MKIIIEDLSDMSFYWTTNKMVITKYPITKEIEVSEEENEWIKTTLLEFDKVQEFLSSKWWGHD